MSLSPLHYEDAVKAALTEDLGHNGDITSHSTLSADCHASATMNARVDGVLAGLDIAALAFKTVDPELTLTAHAKDGDVLSPGDPILTIEGAARAILTAERVALNYLSHLSGIASATAEMVRECAGTHAQIADTRKTTPNMRSLEKYAVRMGGGVNHRLRLDDAILIKDNHIAAAGGIDAVLNATKAAAGHMVKIEIEVDNLEQLQDVLNNGKADIVMVDNFSLEDTKIAVGMVDGCMTVEYSGTVTTDKVADIAQTGVDIISSGWITHSAPTLDIGLDMNLNA
jgi:nicotinate-nucleotide pyrophosphorylase (carboxylating)